MTTAPTPDVSIDPDDPNAELLYRAKQFGFSDEQIAHIVTAKRRRDARTSGDVSVSGASDLSAVSTVSNASVLSAVSTADVRALRERLGIRPVYKTVDTCAGEFEAHTPYFYSTYEPFNEARPTDAKKIIILGGGPNRIGQGIEFDTCCVQAVFALRELGFETIMINSNPETVSTDYDIADRLYFEPLTIEDVLAVCDLEKPDGVIVQLGGQTPLKLARGLEAAGVPIIGTSPDSIDLAEDRDRFGRLLDELDIAQPPGGSGRTVAEVRVIAERIGYPVLVRPSYVLGGRAMEIVYNEGELDGFAAEALRAAEGNAVLVDRFLDDAIEVDVDAVADGENVTIAAIMEHIEQAGVHSGDSACVIPTRSLSEAVLETIRTTTRKLGLALGVRGLMNIQFAIKDETVYVLEVNPRASRTVPFVSKTIGRSVARIAAAVMAGKTLAELKFTEEPRVNFFAVKEAVLPFSKFPGCTVGLGPEMRSTGEAMGISPDFAMAYAKSQKAAGSPLPLEGTVLVSIADIDKDAFVEPIRLLSAEGFRIFATPGTARFLAAEGVQTETVHLVTEGRPNGADLIVNGEIDLVINTYHSAATRKDEHSIRPLAISRGIPLITTAPAALAAAQAIEQSRRTPIEVRALQDYHAGLAGSV